MTSFAARALGLLLFANAATAEPRWQAATVTMHAVQVSEHCWYVAGRLEDASPENQGFMSNAGFVITDDGVVVFDALGSPALAARLIEIIGEHTAQPIRRVIISHYHADHFYGIPALRDAGAEIWAHTLAHQYLNSAAAQTRLEERRASLGPWLGNQFQLPLPDRWLIDGETFDMGGLRFRLHFVGPGHAPEDLVMSVEDDGVVFAGDTIYAARVPFVGTADTALWLLAIERLLEIPARVLVPGHGPASYAPREDLQLTHDYLSFLRTEMGRAVANFQTFDDAYASAKWGRFAQLPAFAAANRANAYNVYLQIEQETLQP